MLWFCDFDFDNWFHGDDDGQQHHRRRRPEEGFMASCREDGNMQGFLSILIDPTEEND
ncbi:hypothetical protein TSUD_329780 [Trifolium subterraneum]|nr:hypothetical protein TSUD_329780 [Trifolium subterraneum]